MVVDKLLQSYKITTKYEVRCAKFFNNTAVVSHEKRQSNVKKTKMGNKIFAIQKLVIISPKILEKSTIV